MRAIRLYLDGVLVASDLGTPDVPLNTKPVHLGTDPALATQFHGTLSDIHFYGATLQPDEIADFSGL